MNPGSHCTHASRGVRGAARPWLLVLLVIVAVAAAVWVWLVGGPGPTGFSRGAKVQLADYHGADPTGVPAALANESLIKRGEYLTRAADCVVCHTARGGAQFAGGFAFTLPFGTIYSTNITADNQTGIGSYSDAQFLEAVHRGKRRDGARLYPAMPYPSFTYMTDADALAIKAYLFSLPPVHASARANTLSFPFNQRALMVLWSMFFNANERFRPDASQSPAWNRGAYLAEALAHCGECHTPRNLAFALNERRKFAGALTAGWHAYNISADQGTGIGAWRDEELAAYLREGHAQGRGTASGPMGEAVDDSFSRLDPADISALVAYLRSVPAVSSREQPAQLAGPASASHREGPQDVLGKQVFEGACASCHGWSGQSPLSSLATLTGARAVNDPKATNVVQVILAGVDRTTPQGALQMPGFGTTYSDTEIAAVANYVTARFGVAGSRLGENEVAALRRQTQQ
jgi:mono/diheme cytochrome c family protein